MKIKIKIKFVHQFAVSLFEYLSGHIHLISEYRFSVSVKRFPALRIRTVFIYLREDKPHGGEICSYAFAQGGYVKVRSAEREAEKNSEIPPVA